MLNKKTIFNLAMVLILPATALGAKPSKMKSDDISNLIIEGENRLRVRGVMPAINWTPDVYRNVNTEFRSDQLVAGLVPPRVVTPPLTFWTRLNSSKTASPWLANIYESPLVTLAVKPKDKDRVFHWVFLVKDSQGQVAYELKKKSRMPEEIVWDGFDRKKSPIHVGFDYTYSLSIIDEAGNPKRFSGDSFRVPAFRYQKGGRTTQLFDPDVLFESKSSSRLSKEGLGHVTEVKDLARVQYGKKISIVAYDDDRRFAQARINVIRDFMVKSLDYSEDKISVLVQPKKMGQGYRHVEITIQ